MRVADMLRQCLTGEVRHSMAEAVCEEPARIQRVADAAAGLLVAAMAKLAEQPEGARALLTRLREDDQVSLSDLHETTRGSQANMLMERGSEQILQLFGGDFFEAAGRAISAYGGLGLGTSKSILCLMTPIALTAVHRGSSDRASLDAMALCHALAQEAEATAKLIPDGFWAVASGEARLRPIAEYLQYQPEDSPEVPLEPSPSLVGSFLSRFMPWAF